MRVEVIGIDHIYLAVRDPRRSEDFYDDVLLGMFGFRKNRSTIGGDAHVHYYNRHFGLSLRPARTGSPAHDPYGSGLHHLCLRVDAETDVDAVAHGLDGLGVAVSVPRLYPEYAPDYYACFFEDPDGVRLEVTNFRVQRRRRMFAWDAEPGSADLRVSDGLWLRARDLAQAEPLFRLVDSHRDHLRGWLPWVDSTISAAQTRAFLQVSMDQALRGEAAVFVVEHNGELAGVCGFNKISALNRSGEVGYWLREDRQRRGIMTACVRRLLEFGFVECDLNRISLAAAVDNRRSRAVAERAGFVLEGTARQAEWVNDRFVDHALYALLRSEWRR